MTSRPSGAIWLCRLAVAGALVMWARAGAACTVPVFRYALERWSASPYECLVFHSGPLAPERSGALRRLQETVDGNVLPANVALTMVDLDKPKEMSDSLRQLWETHKAAAAKSSEPWLIVRYPLETRIEKEFFAGPLTQSVVDDLLVSPARTELARRVLSGDSVVWLLLDSGDAAKDEAAVKMMEQELARLGKEIKLPEIEVEDQRFMTAAQPPLRISFSVLRVRHDDPAEQVLRDLLVGKAIVGKDHPAGPLAVPVVGRGRAAGLIGGEELKPTVIEDAARFLTGECSCTAKEGMGGLDLLISADWEGLISGRFTLAEALPRLTTPAALVEAKQALPANPGDVVPSETGEAGETGAADEAGDVLAAAVPPLSTRDPLTRNLLIAGVVLLGVLLGAVAAVLFRRPKTE